MKKVFWKKAVAFTMAGIVVLSQWTIAPAEIVDAGTTTTLTSSATPEQIDDPVKLSEVQWFDLANTGINTGYGEVEGVATQASKRVMTDDYETGLQVTKTYHSSSTGWTIGYQPGAANTTDISEMNYLEFKMYIPTAEDLALFQSTTNASLELSSSGKSDQAEINCNLTKISSELTVGWNDIKLALHDFGNTPGDSGDFNPAGLNFLRMFIYPSGDNWTTDKTFSLGITGFKFVEYDTIVYSDAEVSKSNTGTTTINGGVEVKRDLPVDASNMDYLEFDIYLSDTSIFNTGSQIELRPYGSNNDNNELHWVYSEQIQAMHWQAGWNHVKLSLQDATWVDTDDSIELSLKKINYFRFYINPMNPGSYSIKNIRFTKEVDNVAKKYIVDAAGNGHGLTGATADAFHYATNDASYTTNNYFSKMFDAVDVRGYQFVEFDLWLADASQTTGALLNDAGFELTSSGKSDNAEMSFKRNQLLGLTLSNGWNHVKLSLSDFVSGSADAIDWSAVNFFRLFFAGYTGGMMIDNLCFTAYDTQDTTTPVKILLNKADSTSNHEVAGDYTEMSVDANEKCLTFTTTNSGDIGFRFNRHMQYQHRHDITSAKYLEFDLWTSDAKLFTYGDSQIQLISGSDWDESEAGRMAYVLKDVKLTTGWNHIKVELPEGGSKFNEKDVRGVRFYAAGVPANTTIKVKNFYATSDTKVEGTYPFLKDKPADTTEYDATWQTATYTKLAEISDCYTTADLAYGGDMNNAMVGRTSADGNYIAATLTGGYDLTSTGNMNCTTSIAITDTYTADQLALAMQLYIEDVDAFKNYKGAQVELASGEDDIDTNDIYWNISELHLQSGWNQLVLPFAEADTSKGTFDKTDITKFRIYLSAWEDMIVAVDDIKIVALADDTAVTDISVYPDGYWITTEENSNYTVENPYENGFTFVALPDLQEITGSHADMLETMFSNIVEINPEFVIGLGDLTWTGCYAKDITKSESQQASGVSQFQTVRAAFEKLDAAEIRYSNAYGNHDYTPGGSTSTGVKDTSVFNENFNYDEYVAMDIYGTANIGGEGDLKVTTWGVYEADKMDNAYYKVNVGGIKYLILSLEFMSGSNAGLMEWANKIVQAHPNYNVIVSTHSYLEPDSNEVEPNKGKLSGSETQYGTYLWNELVEGNSNIKMVLCGHVINDADEGSHLSLLGTHSDGTAVYQYMFNSQDVDTYYGGLGVMTLIHFSEDGKNITFRYYSPVQDAFYKDSNQFTINVDKMAPIMQGDVNDDDTLDIRDLVRAKTGENATEENPVEYNPWVFNTDGTKTTEISNTETAYVRKTLLED